MTGAVETKKQETKIKDMSKKTPQVINRKRFSI